MNITKVTIVEGSSIAVPDAPGLGVQLSPELLT